MGAAETRTIVEAYLDGHDANCLAPDAVFTDTATGERYEGRDAIGAMLEYVYHVGLDAEAEVIDLLVDDGRAILEAEIVGTHIGDFAGVAATGREVRIPLAVSYHVSDGAIRRATVYLQAASFLRQVSQP